MSVAELLDGRHVCVCAGSGGVGKTTTSAAVATGMAARGLKVAVLTIDPAKRLATSLGLSELDNEERRIDPEIFERQGIEMRGEVMTLPYLFEPDLGLAEWERLSTDVGRRL